MATRHYDKSDPVNVGSGVEVSIREFVLRICELTGYSGKIIWDSNRPDGQPRRLLDTSRARMEFGFDAPTELGMGLVKTVEWYRSELISRAIPGRCV